MTESTLFQILFGLIFFAMLAIAMAHRISTQAERGAVSHAEEPTLIFLVLRGFGYAIWLMFLLTAVYPKALTWATLDLPSWLRWVGVGLGIIGLPIEYGATRAIRGNVTKTVAIRDDHELVTSGPYRWVRHPLYTAGSLMFIGLALIAGNWVMMALMVPGAVALAKRLPIEEAKLIEAFGDDYREYMSHTGAVIPKLF